MNFLVALLGFLDINVACLLVATAAGAKASVFILVFFALTLGLKIFICLWDVGSLFDFIAATLLVLSIFFVLPAWLLCLGAFFIGVKGIRSFGL
ncbi:MAG: hypothetical protein AAB724_00545 [Patescibacteria group bacterium]